MKLNHLEYIGRKLRPVELKLLTKWILNLKRKRIVLEDERVYDIDQISDLGLRLMKDGKYEPDMTKLINQLLKEGDCFIDLGANEGYFSVLAALLVKDTGYVFAVEPQQRLWSIILNNFVINRLKNVQLLPYGIGAENEELTLQLYPTTNSGATSFSKSFNFKMSFSQLRKKIYGTQNAKVITLDSLINRLPSEIKLIKIDIEGFELEALKGAEKLLANNVFEHLLIEIHPEALKGLDQSEKMIDDYLEKYNYCKEIVGHNLNLYKLK